MVEDHAESGETSTEYSSKSSSSGGNDDTAEISEQALEILVDEARHNVQYEEVFKDELLNAIEEAEEALHSNSSSLELEQSEIGIGDILSTPCGPVKILPGGAADELVVEDPTVSHPQDSRAGTWRISKYEVKRGLRNDEIEPASLTVVKQQGDTQQ